jgi:hypothetical protein
MRGLVDVLVLLSCFELMVVAIAIRPISLVVGIGTI